RQVRRAARAAADEVGLFQREALGERRHLDQAAHTLGRRRDDAEPVPAALDDLAEGADREPPKLLGQRRRVADAVTGPRAPALARDADGDGRALRRAAVSALDR